jgi:basic membrane protein A
VNVLVGYAGVRPEAFADPVRGKEIALSQIGQGADVVFHAAGVTGLGVIEAAREKGKLAIGVDSNQNGVAPGTVLTSMIKRVDNALHAAIVAAYRGEFRGGEVEFGLAEDGVGFALDEHNEALLTEEMLDRAAALRDSVVEGLLEVPVETGRT